MKNTEKLTFVKTVSSSTNSTEAIITIEHGTNKKGEPFRNLDQVNTANQVIDDLRDSFEDFEISLAYMIEVVQSQGYIMIDETLELKESAVRTFVKKNSFSTKGMFTPYQFIAVAKDENGKAYLYHSIQPSSNSWTNYPGRKIWDNKNESVNKKKDVLEFLLSELDGFNLIGDTTEQHEVVIKLIS